MANEKKSKKIKELFVQDLARIQGGRGETAKPSVTMPPYTTLACCEEADDPCCVVN